MNQVKKTQMDMKKLIDELTERVKKLEAQGGGGGDPAKI